MTTPPEMVQSIISARRFLYSLLDTKETPRVPSVVRREARGRLKHYPAPVNFPDLGKELRRIKC